MSNARKGLIAAALAPLAVASAAPQEAGTSLPGVPAHGEMGFVVHYFVPPVIQGADACPEGLALKTRDLFVLSLPEGERARLLEKASEPEFDRRWRASVYGENGTNICSQPDMFPGRPLQRTVQSRFAVGLDLDGDNKSGGQGCAHESFTSPAGEPGIDNQAYRVMGCTQEWRGTDGKAGDIVRGFNQFVASGEWTQVILLRGVDSLVHDDDVEVVYANTSDRPAVDAAGNFLAGASYTISEAPPRHRNVLRGRIENGVVTTETADIVLTQSWGQGRPRDIRGHRTKWDFRRGRLRLTIQPDGSLNGLLGGYQPVADLIQSTAIGGAGSALDAGTDCAGQLRTLLKYADGIRDPRTGACTGVSSAVEVRAVPAFVNDVAPGRTSAR